MNHKDNKAMRCTLSVLLTVVFVVVAFGIGYQNWNNTAFEAQAKMHSPLESVSYETFVTEGDGEQLSTEQKVNDFLFLSQMLTENTFLDEGNEALLGISQEERNAEYLELVKATQNDVEFYFVLQRYLCGMKSVHTYMVTPNYDRYISYADVRTAQDLRAEISKEKIDAFEMRLSEAAAETEQYPEKVFLYVEGSYYEIGTDNRIVRMNGKENVQEELDSLGLFYKMDYDFLRESMYYPFVIFNEGYGTEVVVEMSSGEVYTLNHAPEVEYRVLRSDYELTGKVFRDFMYLYEEGTAYLRIGSLARDRADELEMVMQCYEREENAVENLIVDLRGNLGGTAANVLYGVLDKVFPVEITTGRDFYLPYTEWNRSVQERYNGINVKETKLTRNVPKEIKDGNYYYHITEERSVGSRENKKCTVYVLVNNETASAADWLAHYLREYMGAVVVGQNTAGEGLSDSPVYTLLPNSGFLVSYFDSYAKNAEGRSNSVYGTEPDYYVENTIGDVLAPDESEKEKSMQELMKDDTQLRFIFEELLGEK